MLTLAELEEALADISYKPGWSFSLHQHRWEGVKIRILAEVRNSYQPDQVITLGIDSFLPSMADVNQFHGWLADRLGRIESHEMREWLRKDGKPLFDPHKEQV